MTIFSIFGFLAEFAFMGKFGPKNQNRQFSLKFVTYSVSDQKHSFLGKFGPKNQNCLFKLKFGTYTNLNMQNSMAVFTLSVLYRIQSV